MLFCRTGSWTPRTLILESPDPTPRPKHKDTHRGHLLDHLREEKTLCKNLQENILPGKVRLSRCTSALLILFVRKQARSLMPCVDYRALNCLTIPNKYHLPLISELLDQTRCGRWFTRLDLKNRYNLIRIAAEDKWKRAFPTKEGLFNYTVMPFCLTNAPALFQEMIGTIFKDMEGCI